MAFYYHQPLADGEIRVLDLLPPDGTDEVRCRIRHVRLSDQPKYEALSYCWGDPKDTLSIFCDGYVMKVTKNLYSFLTTHRYPVGSRTLWTDAICIDQSNDLERGAQVRIMDQIYAKAVRVLVWLGPAASDSDEAMSLIRHLSTVEWEAYDNQTWNPQDPKSVPDDSDMVWFQLSVLLEREYFRRIWVCIN